MRVNFSICGCVILVACTTGESSKTRPQEAVPLVAAAPPPPIVVSIASNEAREVKAGTFADYSFDLPNGSCTLKGKVEGVTGGNKDFEAFIMDDENFKNWSAHFQASVIESGRKMVWSFNDQIAGPGKWHLVVSNAFSSVTDKAYSLSASATCPRA